MSDENVASQETRKHTFLPAPYGLYRRILIVYVVLFILFMISTIVKESQHHDPTFGGGYRSLGVLLTLFFGLIAGAITTLSLSFLLSALLGLIKKEYRGFTSGEALRLNIGRIVVLVFFAAVFLATLFVLFEITRS